MNKKQRVFLWIGFVIVLIAGLFPPWKSIPIDDAPDADLHTFYIIFSAPPHEFRMATREYDAGFGSQRQHHVEKFKEEYASYRIDNQRFIIEGATLVVLLLVGTMALKSNAA